MSNDGPWARYQSADGPVVRHCVDHQTLPIAIGMMCEGCEPWAHERRDYVLVERRRAARGYSTVHRVCLRLLGITSDTRVICLVGHHFALRNRASEEPQPILPSRSEHVKPLIGLWRSHRRCIAESAPTTT